VPWLHGEGRINLVHSPDGMTAVELMQRMFAAKMNPMHSVLVMIFCNIHPRPILQGF
jgi:hypothetical protein